MSGAPLSPPAAPPYPAKCFASAITVSVSDGRYVVALPFVSPCSPATAAVARWAVSTGSGAKPSWNRPNRGSLKRLITGANATLAPHARVSRATAAYTADTRLAFHALASVSGIGNTAAPAHPPCSDSCVNERGMPKRDALTAWRWSALRCATRCAAGTVVFSASAMKPTSAGLCGTFFSPFLAIVCVIFSSSDILAMRSLTRSTTGSAGFRYACLKCLRPPCV